MEDDRVFDQASDFVQPVEIESRLTFELESTVGGADGDRQRIDTSIGYKLHRLLRHSESGLGLHLSQILDPSQLADLGFDLDSAGVRVLHDFPRGCDVLLQRQPRGVDHHGGISGLYGSPRHFDALPVVHVKGDRNRRLFGQATNDRGYVGDASVLDGAFRGLNHHGRPQVCRCGDDRSGGLQVVNVERSNRPTVRAARLEIFERVNQQLRSPRCSRIGWVAPFLDHFREPLVRVPEPPAEPSSGALPSHEESGHVARPGCRAGP